MGRKLTYDEVKLKIAQGGDTLVSTTYEGVNSDLTILCHRCKETYEMSLHAYAKYKCQKCGKKQAADKLKTGIDEVRAYIQEHGDGDTLISNVYVGTHLDLEIACGICHKINPISFSYYKDGGRCRCASERSLFDTDFVRKYIAEEGDELISPEYKRNDVLLEIKCGNCSKIYPKTFHYYYHEGFRCPDCHN